MVEWIAFKDQIAQWAGLDRDALQIYAGVLLQLAAAGLLRKPVASAWPWLAALLVEIANEAASTLADARVEGWEVQGNVADLWVTMLLPSLLMLVARLAPRLLIPEEVRPVTRIGIPDQFAGSPAEDAEFVEYVENADGAWSPSEKA